jgi:DNA-directed RNA polymerase specialized sigma24 family protein
LRGISRRAVADALAAFYPSLLDHAARRLKLSPGGYVRHLDSQLREDVVQEAIARWLQADPDCNSSTEMHNYLRKAIDNLTANMVNRHPDALDNEPASLDEPWARG